MKENIGVSYEQKKLVRAGQSDNQRRAWLSGRCVSVNKPRQMSMTYLEFPNIDPKILYKEEKNVKKI